MNQFQAIPFLLLLIAVFSNTSITETLPGKTPTSSPKKHNIQLTIQVNDHPKDTIIIYYQKKTTDTVNQSYISLSSAVIKGKARFSINSTVPVALYTAGLHPSISGWTAEPGDSVDMVINKHTIELYGEGCEKYKLLVELDSFKKITPKPDNPNNFITQNISDYFNTHEYLNKIQTGYLSIIEKYKPTVSQEIYLSLKVNCIKRMQENRLDKFNGLIPLAYKQQLSIKDLCLIFDTSFNSTEWKWALKQSKYLGGWYAYVRAIVGREHSFNYSSDSMKNSGLRRILYYNRGKQLFSGLSKEQFLVDLVTNEGIDEIGFTPEINYLLSKYYKEPGYPAFKEFVRRYEEKNKKLKPGAAAPIFHLKDVNNKNVFLSDYTGKLILLDFWFTGCTGCIQMVPALRQVEEKFRNDTNIVFLSISTDKEKAKWLKSVRQQKYTTGSGTNLYTEGLGTEHAIIKDYHVTSYPNLFLINENGKIIQNPLPDPRKDNGDSLHSIIMEHLEYLTDGPYVLHKDDSVSIYHIKGNKVHLAKKHLTNATITVPMRQKLVTIPLKPRHVAEPCVFTNASKIFAISDIEGNLKAFTRLLIANHIVDENFLWTFGNGHLVLTGDFFDRGKQVTECLWLIYSLEEQARQAGGYVHFILGNHEIMNISGDTRYVQDKYKQNAAKTGMEYTQLYGPQTELGRWLRTKNIAEKIGDILFVHGGISDELNNAPLSIEDINKIARNNYDEKSADSSLSNLIMNNPTSPFWYRLYYQSTDKRVDGRGKVTWKATQQQINKTCIKFEVKKIVTGHTIIGDSINTHFQNRVINIDTHHAKGFSEALLITENQFFRTNQEGIKTSLFQNK